VVGLVYGLSRYRWPGVFFLAPTLALVTAVYSLIFVISPAYAPPPILTEQDLPAASQRLDIYAGKGLDLVAAQVETEEAYPGEQIWVTLYWRAETIPGSVTEQEAPMLVLELFGKDNQLIGKYQSYHGGGLYPANYWQPGEIIADEIAVDLFEEANAPVLARLNVKVVGETISVDVGTVKVIPQEWPEFSADYLAQAEGIQLGSAAFSADSVAPGDTVEVDLIWQVLEPPQRDLTTFVHLGDPTQPPLIQGDSLPLGGDYPTRLWSAGERFSDMYHLDIPAHFPPGTYPIQIGFYDPTDGSRLPIIAGGERQAYDAYQLGWLVVTR
jgi:hypothetical protein